MYIYIPGYIFWHQCEFRCRCDRDQEAACDVRGGTQAPWARCLTRFGMIRGFYKRATATTLAACKGPRCDAGPASGQGPDDTESRDNTKAGQGYSGAKGTRSGMMQARTQKVNGLPAATRLQYRSSIGGRHGKRTGSAQSASLLSEKITLYCYTTLYAKSRSTEIVVRRGPECRRDLRAI